MVESRSTAWHPAAQPASFKFLCFTACPPTAAVHLTPQLHCYTRYGRALVLIRRLFNLSEVLAVHVDDSTTAASAI